ncbi:hypothetical protein BGZ95_011024 [Linnemannia exigua]|uniref:FHA domain-containing protein n=1 Tax=Linnemannia exigua TaxID=604196 RepID=A0AAD4DC95_9FUNG|nr:hypothetical protein BGZ95_011024 [Linnemannia exigua]
MLFQPPYPDSDREMSPSSHEDGHLWSQGEPSSYKPLETTHSQTQVAGGYRAPSYSPSEDFVEYTTATTTARPVPVGNSFSSSGNNQFVFGLYDDEDDDIAIAIQEEDELQKQQQQRRLQQHQQMALALTREEDEERQEEEDEEQQEEDEEQQEEDEERQEEDEERQEEEYENESELTPFVTRPLNSSSSYQTHTDVMSMDIESDDGEENEQTFTVPHTHTTLTPPLVHLEIQELRACSSGHEHHRLSATSTLPRPRQFIFEPNNRLLLGRAPSSGLDPKTRLRQLSNVASDAVGQARPENGYDDGLFSNQVISKLHAAIYEEHGQLVLEDRDSTHGTFLNDEPISRQYLHDLDRVRLGRPVTRKDIFYTPLEFIVRIQIREHYEHPSAQDPATFDPLTGIDQQDLLHSATITSHSKQEVIVVDDEFDEDERSNLLSCTQVESLDILKPEERTPTEDKQDIRESGYGIDVFQQTENVYEADNHEPEVVYDDIAFQDLDNVYDDGDADENDCTVSYQQGQEYNVDNVNEEEGDEYDDLDEDVDAFNQNTAEYAFEKDGNNLLESIKSSPGLSDIENNDSVLDQDALEESEDDQEPAEAIIKATSPSSNTMTTVSIVTVAATASIDAVEETHGNKRKREEPEEVPLLPTPAPKSKKTALFAAALAGMVVGSVGTVLTLANL